MAPLHYDYYAGDKSRTVVMLHGLFGSAKNFTTLAESLTPFAEVYAYDARNHGRSAHTATHTLTNLVDDLRVFIDQRQIENPILIGHSMGGLTAMAYTAKYKARGLVVLDIAPRTYLPNHEQEIAAQKIDVSRYATRHKIDAAMAEILSNATVRQFLQMNVTRDPNGNFMWMNNIDAIDVSPERTQFIEFTPPLFTGPVLAVRGLASDYVTDADVTLMQKAFPLLRIESLEGATHWLHHTHRDVLLGFLGEWLRGIN